MTNYEDVWPSSSIGDQERGALQSTGEVIVDDLVILGDVAAMVDDLGLELEAIQLSWVQATNGPAIKVRVLHDWKKP